MELKDLIKKQEKESKTEWKEFFVKLDSLNFVYEADTEEEMKKMAYWWIEKISKIRKETIEHEREKIQNIIKDMPDTFPELESDDYDEAYQDAKQYMLSELL